MERKIKIPSPEEIKIQQLEEKNRFLEEQAEFLQETMDTILLDIIPSIISGGEE